LEASLPVPPGGHATWHANAWPRSSKSLRPHPKR
jgi:hypothetical protein